VAVSCGHGNEPSVKLKDFCSGDRLSVSEEGLSWRWLVTTSLAVIYTICNWAALKIECNMAS
jgi:hypothetical protein